MRIGLIDLSTELSFSYFRPTVEGASHDGRQLDGVMEGRVAETVPEVDVRLAQWIAFEFSKLLG